MTCPAAAGGLPLLTPLSNDESGSKPALSTHHPSLLPSSEPSYYFHRLRALSDGCQSKARGRISLVISKDLAEVPESLGNAPPASAEHLLCTMAENSSGFSLLLYGFIQSFALAVELSDFGMFSLFGI